ncbi:MAG: chromosome segregation protein SMC [Candidatus Limnocylindria bacterium]
MSRLQELRLHGFKSFAEPTRFVFEPGVTAVIGPNGSGKSNMADAIRWVLGEQSNRSLRTWRADDVIFAGSEARRPIGMAEVALTLDNHDGWLPIEFESVTITRRAYRSGDPEYLINGSRARLRDVVELLAAGRLGANELVVVGQGTVDAALSLRPDERRQLFEEAAGVKSLQVRRNEAMARLGRARENLTRVADLVRELRPQVRRLALQAEHQEAHDRLGGRARALVLEHHARRGQLLQASLGEARRRAAAVAADIESERAERATGRRALAKAEERYWAGEREGRRIAAEWESAREAVIRAEGRHDSLVERDLDLAAEADRGQRELADLVAEEPGESPAASGSQPDPLGGRAAAAQAAWLAATERARAADADLLAAEEALAAVRGREADRLAAAGTAAARIAAEAARREHLERDLAAASTALTEAAAVAAELVDARRAAGVELEQAEERLARAAADREAAAGEAARAAAGLADLEERAAGARAELAELAATGDRVANDLADRLRAAGWTTLRDGLPSVPPEAASAVAALLGDVERSFVWRTGVDLDVDDTSGEAHLLRSGNGVPPGRDAALQAVGATQTLAELLGGRVGADILQRTVVAPDIAALLDGWPRLPDGWAAVTLSGDLADARGVVTVRGRAGARRPVLGRDARQAELTIRVKQLDEDRDAALARQDAARASLDRTSVASDAAVAAVEAARIGRRRVDEDSAAADAALARLTTSRDALIAGVAGLPEVPSGPPLTGLDQELARLEEAALGARASRDAAAAEREAAREAWQQAVAAADAQDLMAGDRRSSAARFAERRDQLEQRLVRLAADRSAMATALADASSTLAAARAAENTAAEARARTDEAQATDRQALLDAERHHGGGDGHLAELEGAQQQVVAEVSRLEEALAGLDRERELALEGLPERPGEDLPVPDDEPPPAGLADEELAEAMRKTRRTLQQIGSVNPFAIEEHREVSARLEELTEQETDLRAAAESTDALIARLDEEIGGQFQAAFAAIGQRFDEYCRLLFAGGSATLELTEDAESEAPGGIEIAVRPPGKRLQRLAMLSGGERALAGVALLFAMLSVNPVPFCILDEVDAALDEANITRFADALRRLAETIDFVVITHNRATIETADTIYGVTMTDAAVSRVLSLRLADMPVEVSA